MSLTSNKVLELYEESKVIMTVKELNSVYKKRDKDYPISFDTETTSISFNTQSWIYQDKNIIDLVDYPFVFGVSMAIMSEGRINLFWTRHSTSLFTAVCEILEKENNKTAHNARYDIRVMKENGFDVAPDIDCTYTMAKIYWDRRRKHSLKALAEILCPELSGYEEEVKNSLRKIRTKYRKLGFNKDYVNYSFIPDNIMAKYSLKDAFFGLIFWMYFNEKAVWR